MTRARISTTVDADALHAARALRNPSTDAALFDEALQALLAKYRAAELDETYVAYDAHPIDEPDAWGDLGAFREAAAST